LSKGWIEHCENFDIFDIFTEYFDYFEKDIFKEPSFPRPQFQSLGLDSAQSVRAVWILKGMGNVGDIPCCDGVGVRIIRGYDML